MENLKLYSYSLNNHVDFLLYFSDIKESSFYVEKPILQNFFWSRWYSA